MQRASSLLTQNRERSPQQRGPTYARYFSLKSVAPSTPAAWSPDRRSRCAAAWKALFTVVLRGKRCQWSIGRGPPPNKTRFLLILGETSGSCDAWPHVVHRGHCRVRESNNPVWKSSGTALLRRSDASLFNGPLCGALNQALQILYSVFHSVFSLYFAA